MTAAPMQPDVARLEPAPAPGGALQRLRRNPAAVVSAAMIASLVFAAVFAPWLSGHAYDAADRANVLVGPMPGHLLGTDNHGQDLWARLLFGARVSLAIGIIVEAIEVLIGVTLGMLAAYKGGVWDTVLMRVTDAMFAFPDLLFAILLVGILRPTSPFAGFLTVFVALALVNWPSMARIVRGQALAVREKEFVEAARAIGVPDREIVFRHLLPNILSPILVAATVDIANVVLAEATLSFLGIGIQPPFPSWGRMISDALPYLRSAPMLLVYPAVALALLVLSFNFLGDALRDALDPRLRR
ncbi:MAG: ABC transporter permease [Armatimonadetes bacterium]|nr:ABC transporter permease [Armatimonadota bacterium]